MPLHRCRLILFELGPCDNGDLVSSRKLSGGVNHDLLTDLEALGDPALAVVGVTDFHDLAFDFTLCIDEPDELLAPLLKQNGLLGNHDRLGDVLDQDFRFAVLAGERPGIGVGKPNPNHDGGTELTDLVVDEIDFTLEDSATSTAGSVDADVGRQGALGLELSEYWKVLRGNGNQNAHRIVLNDGDQGLRPPLLDQRTFLESTLADFSIEWCDDGGKGKIEFRADQITGSGLDVAFSHFEVRDEAVEGFSRDRTGFDQRTIALDIAFSEVALSDVRFEIPSGIQKHRFKGAWIELEESVPGFDQLTVLKVNGIDVPRDSSIQIDVANGIGRSGLAQIERVGRGLDHLGRHRRVALTHQRDGFLGVTGTTTAARQGGEKHPEPDGDQR